jgi:hypothetical protein
MDCCGFSPVEKGKIPLLVVKRTAQGKSRSDGCIDHGEKDAWRVQMAQSVAERHHYDDQEIAFPCLKGEKTDIFGFFQDAGDVFLCNAAEPETVNGDTAPETEKHTDSIQGPFKMCQPVAGHDAKNHSDCRPEEAGGEQKPVTGNGWFAFFPES